MFGRARGNAQVCLNYSFGQALTQLLPILAAVRRFEYPTTRSIPGSIFPGALTRLPQRRVDNVGMGWIDLHIGGADVLVFIEDLFEILSPVSRTENATFFIRPIRMTGDRH